jgi:hypothetical protein
MAEEKQLPSVLPKALPAAQEQMNWLANPLEHLDKIERMGALFVKSGLFKPTDKEASQGVSEEQRCAEATVKIIAGAEYGLTPFKAMKGLHNIKGKLTPSYQVIGAKIKSTPGYDYKVLQRDEQVAKIEFFRGGQSLGVSTFTRDDAAKAQLINHMYNKFGRNMLFARAMTDGANAYVPEIFDGPIYTPADFGVAVDDNGDPVIEAEATEVKEKAAPKPAAKKEQPKPQPAPASDSAKPAASSAPAQPESATPAAQESSATATTAEEITDVASTPIDPPAPASAINDLMQAAVNAGYTPEEANPIVCEQLTSAGVDLSTFPNLVWTVSQVQTVIDYLANNKKK